MGREDVVTLYVSWSADRLNARAYHAAACATIGAAGFMASALLPATSFKVSLLAFPSIVLNVNRFLASIRLSHCCLLRSFWLYPPFTWLDILKPSQYRCGWPGDSSQHLNRHSRTNYWSMDLHCKGSIERLPNRSLDELCYASVCRRWLHCLGHVLPSTERKHPKGKWWS